VAKERLFDVLTARLLAAVKGPGKEEWVQAAEERAKTRAVDADLARKAFLKNSPPGGKDSESYLDLAFWSWLGSPAGKEAVRSARTEAEALACTAGTTEPVARPPSACFRKRRPGSRT